MLHPLAVVAAERKLGVIAASAGNHALGLAYHGQLLGIPVTVVMPDYAPLMTYFVDGFLANRTNERAGADCPGWPSSYRRASDRLEGFR